VRWFKTDVLGLFMGPISRVIDSITLEMGPIGSPETSLLNHLTKRNKPEDGIIQESDSSKSRENSRLFENRLIPVDDNTLLIYKIE
jgi:hypothetical protein